MTPFSVLDLAPIPEGATAADALCNSRDLARHAEALDYQRYWVAEHHNMTGIASAATAVVIAHIAGGTKSIRVGSGGIMLPNHAPLIIAEQFGTLESLFPGRIDLGLGRAPGTDQLTMRALRRDPMSADRFPQDVIELEMYFSDPEPGQRIRAVPGAGLHVPIWLLGSSLFSAQLAAMLGLPFSFASHFAPDALGDAIEIYRSRFEPSAQLQKPYVMPCVNVFAADTEAEARYHFSSLVQSFVNLRRGQPGPLPPPVENIGEVLSDAELEGAKRSLTYSFIGTADMIADGLSEFLKWTRADELMITGHMFYHDARRRSFAIAASVRDRLNARATAAA